MKTKAGLMLIVCAFALLTSSLPADAGTTAESARWSREAAAVTISRDDWGIAHITGKTDADAVFGMIYAQAEDDFNRVEVNYLNSLGRLAEAEGESKIYQDLRMKLFIDPVELKREYRSSPLWLRRLMDAWADGLNFYLVLHPAVKPRVLSRFEPWMALSFTEGSIGGDIERVDLGQLEAFYGSKSAQMRDEPIKPLSYRHEPVTVALAEETNGDTEPHGSNGIAIAPKNTQGKRALLLINPHTSFFFRSELQMTSAEGVNAYGAVTWGQFFVYQGFNDRAGWMHTSSGVDAVDEYVETVVPVSGGMSYRYGKELKPLRQRRIAVPYRTAKGIESRTFTAYYTGHGPVIRELDGKWITIQLMQQHVKALEQSYLRTKARSYKEYAQTMELQANSSNNTIFADADGDIAYWHGNYIPRRDTRFDFTQPVDGTDPATDWQGLLTTAEAPHLLNPASGFLFNVNNWPWAGAGESSLKRSDYPVYVETGAESARGLHAIRVLDGKHDFTPESLMAAAYDTYLPWFDKPLPALAAAWDCLPDTDPRKAKLADQVTVLRTWDKRWGEGSMATTLAVFWGEELRRWLGSEARKAGRSVEDTAADPSRSETLLNALAAASGKLTEDFGTWQTPWGEINRFQRITGDIVQPFSDTAASIPVPFTSAVWGSLASFGARAYPGTKRWYGTSGNSFVAVVEFGDKVRARAVTAGGESGHLASKHFDDEAERYASGHLREVYFYPEQIKAHAERTYRPGQ